LGGRGREKTSNTLYFNLGLLIYSTEQFYFYLIETSSLEDEKNQEDQECTEVPDLDQIYKLTQEEQNLILEDWTEGNLT